MVYEMAAIKFEYGKIEITYNVGSEKLVGTTFNGTDEWVIKIEQSGSNQPQSIVIEKTEPTDSFSKDDLPAMDDVINYIISKPNFEYHNAELQEHFLGRILNSRVDQRLYFAFDMLIRKVKENIENQYSGTWNSSETTKLGRRKRVKVFKFVKSDDRSM